MFNTKLLFITVLLLITIVHGGNTKKHHQDRHHRSVADNEVGYRTSCGESLCASLDSYPKRKTYSACKKFTRLVQSDKSVFQRVLVDSGFLDELDKPKVDPDYENFTLTHYNCNIEKNTFFPLEGQSSDDNELYYIMNVGCIPQLVERKFCKSCKPRDPLEFCHQNFVNYKLLAIPVRKQSFTAEDITVKSFEVPYGCACFIV